MPVSSYTCGARTRSGAPCKNVPMANGRCRMHGGSSLSGEAHPNYKHGKYAGLPPKKVRQVQRMLKGIERRG